MLPSSPQPLEIRDPIHGAIPVDKCEQAVVDHPFVQRLRGIRQLGFSHLPFPGATHTRYLHSLGAMHLAGRAFDACFRDAPFSSPARGQAFRHCLRLAALCHDLGHAPFSHAAEFAMPPLSELGLRCLRPDLPAERLDRRASHEDYTIGILTRSDIGARIRERFPFGPEHVAALVSGEVHVQDDFFVDQGLDFRGLLSQLVSSDLDVDRMDYLVRDSFFTGAGYGQIDTHWLISHLSRHVDESGRVCLALDGRALYAFDDFMVARYHMFVMVYFHQKSVAYEEMLKRYMTAPERGYRLPAELDEYSHTDDAQLWEHLRSSSDPWARRVVELKPYKLAWEAHGTPGEVNPDGARARLQAEGIPVVTAEATGAVFGPRKAGRLPIFVVDRSAGRPRRVQRLEEAAEIFRRYQDQRCIARLYVPPGAQARARRILGVS